MPAFAIYKEDPSDYYLIVDPRPEGPILGVFADLPISESITDCFGRSYIYAGAAPRRRDGRYDIDVLKPGEFLLEPGLVYRLGERKSKSAGSNFLGALGKRMDMSISETLPGAGASTDRRRSAAPDHRSEPDSRSGAASSGPQKRTMQDVATRVMTILSFALVIHILLAVVHGG